MRQKLFALCLLGLIQPLPVAARKLALAEALELARQHSFEVKRAEVEVEAAQAALALASATRWPTLTAEVTAYYVDFVPSIDIRIPSLMNVSAELGTRESYQTDFRLALPLITGGRIVSSIISASSMAAYRQALRDGALDRVYVSVRMAYFGLYRSDQSLAAARSSLERTELIREDTRSLCEAGAADSMAILDVELAVTSAGFLVERAESARRAAEIELATLLNMSPESSLELTGDIEEPTAPPEHPAGLYPIKPELRAAAAVVAANRAAIGIAGASYYPSVSAFAGYSYGKPNLDRFNNDWHDYWTFGARLSWSLNFGGKTQRSVRQAQLGREAAQFSQQLATEQLDREARLAHEGLGLAYARYQTAVKQLQLTTRNYELARQRHREGVVSSNRLLEVETTLTEAESLVAAALADYHIARGYYLYAIGAEELRKGM